MSLKNQICEIMGLAGILIKNNMKNAHFSKTQATSAKFGGGDISTAMLNLRSGVIFFLLLWLEREKNYA